MGVTAVDMPLVKIGKAAEFLGVSVQTPRKREDSGELVPDRRSGGGVRYYDMGKILGLGSEDMPIIGYARVSSHDQKNDLVRQQELLEAFCQPKAGVMRSSPISVRALTTKRKAYSDYWN
jgi:putative resolvase